jgi:hypothetical protein
MPTYRLTVEYDGTRYRGWQEQKNANTVAGELRRVLESFCGERLELAGSGAPTPACTRWRRWRTSAPRASSISGCSCAR